MLGGSYGAQVTAQTAEYDPAVRAAAFVALGTQMAYLSMLEPAVRGPFGADQLAARTPSLINRADASCASSRTPSQIHLATRSNPKQSVARFIPSASFRPLRASHESRRLTRA